MGKHLLNALFGKTVAGKCHTGEDSQGCGTGRDGESLSLEWAANVRAIACGCVGPNSKFEIHLTATSIVARGSDTATERRPPGKLNGGLQSRRVARASGFGDLSGLIADGRRGPRYDKDAAEPVIVSDDGNGSGNW